MSEATKKLFNNPIKVINVGLPSFAQDLKTQGIEVVNLDWRPPAGGNLRLLSLLDVIKRWQADA
ncbi:MAG: fdrA domain protein [Candidatus Riflebacteria bacterium]|nr:fdrA domain protein [Candidatus Riflebacteria bacterium]